MSNHEWPLEVLEVTNDWCYSKFKGLARTVDAVITKKVDGIDYILTIERKRGPDKGAYALPGGIVEPDEYSFHAAAREAYEEVGLAKQHLLSDEHLGTNSINDSYLWDPRTPHGVRVYGYKYVVKDGWTPVAGDDALSYEWVTLDELIDKGMAFLHMYWINQSFVKEVGADTAGKLVKRYTADRMRQAMFIKEVNKKRVADGQPTIPERGDIE